MMFGFAIIQYLLSIWNLMSPKRGWGLGPCWDPIEPRGPYREQGARDLRGPHTEQSIGIRVIY